MTSIRTAISLSLIAPLALALAGCDSADEGEAALNGAVVAAVPAPESGAWSSVASRTPQGGWLVGNPAAKIKLVEYGSLTCPACVAFSVAGSAKLHSEYVESGRVSYEFRSVLIHGAPDLLLTRMLDCAPVSAAVPLAEQVWGNYESIMGGIQANGPALEQAMTLPEDRRFVVMAQTSGITDFFAARGISADQAQICLADKAGIAALAEKSAGQADEDGVNSTPTFFLNGQKLPDTNWAAVQAALQRAGAR